MPGTAGRALGPRTRSGVARDNWLTPRPLGPEPKSPWRVGRPRVPWTKRESPEAGVRHRSTTGMGQSHQGQLVDTAGHRARAQVTRDWWSNPRALGPETELPGTFGRPRVPSDLGRSRPGHLLDPVSPWNRGRVARGSWSTPRDIGHGRESPRRASPPLAIGSEPESWGRVGRHRGP